MPREGSGPGGPSRDRRRLGIGILFMAGFLLSALAAVFLLGRSPEDGLVAPGVPFLVASGWVLVLGAAAVFYRTFPGADREEGEDSDESGPRGGRGAASS